LKFGRISSKISVKVKANGEDKMFKKIIYMAISAIIAAAAVSCAVYDYDDHAHNTAVYNYPGANAYNNTFIMQKPAQSTRQGNPATQDNGAHAGSSIATATPTPSPEPTKNSSGGNSVQQQAGVSATARNAVSTSTPDILPGTEEAAGSGAVTGTARVQDKNGSIFKHNYTRKKMIDRANKAGQDGQSGAPAPEEVTKTGVSQGSQDTGEISGYRSKDAPDNGKEGADNRGVRHGMDAGDKNDQKDNNGQAGQ
jgi:hypothetical protein